MLWHVSENLCGTNTLLYNLHITGCWRWWVRLFPHWSMMLWIHPWSCSVPRRHTRIRDSSSGLFLSLGFKQLHKQTNKNETGNWAVTTEWSSAVAETQRHVGRRRNAAPPPSLSPTCVQVRRVYKGVFLWMETDSGGRSHWDLCHKLSDFLQKDGETARALRRSQPRRLRLENYT